jgi:multimeric flavodoxin WrbA
MKTPRLRSKVLGIGGSPRKNGNSDILLGHFLSGARQAGAKTEAVYLRAHRFSPCIGCEKCRPTGECAHLDDAMAGLYPKVIESGGLVLVSPVHNYNITAWMKAFIDRLYCFYDFVEPRPGSWSSRLADQGRQAVVSIVGEQRDKDGVGVALEALQMPLEALGYHVLEQFSVFGVFDKGRIARQRETLYKAKQIGTMLAQATQKSFAGEK